MNNTGYDKSMIQLCKIYISRGSIFDVGTWLKLCGVWSHPQLGRGQPCTGVHAMATQGVTGVEDNEDGVVWDAVSLTYP